MANYCPNCGSSISGANYCPNCGAQINADGTAYGASTGSAASSAGTVAASVLGTLVTVSLVNGLTRRLYYYGGRYFLDPYCRRPFGSPHMIMGGPRPVHGGMGMAPRGGGMRGPGGGGMRGPGGGPRGGGMGGGHRGGGPR